MTGAMDNDDEGGNHDNNNNNNNTPAETAPIAKKKYTSFQKARHHVYKDHHKEVTKRTSGDHGSAMHVYNDTNVKRYTQAGVRIIVKLACISCTRVFDSRSDLASHVDETHVIQKPALGQLPTDNHWIVQGQDVPPKFHQYRQSCITVSSTTTFAVDTNFNELLSMSGILVLQKRYNYQSLSNDIFPPTLLKEMRQDVIGKYHRHPFNPGILTQVNTIIQKFVDDDISETSAKIQLLSLCENASHDKCGVLNAIVALISYLYDCDMKPISEAHLTASYIHPFVHSLLSAKTPASVAHCSNVAADENEDTNNRPDYKVDIYASGYRYSYTNAYGEVKPSNQVSPTLLVNDFYRLAIFSKDALDKFILNQVLAFQAIGNCVTFFAMSLSFPQLYTFTKLVRFIIYPRSLILLT